MHDTRELTLRRELLPPFFCVVVTCAACNKSDPPKPIDAGPTILAPMNVDPPKPSASSPSPPGPGPAAWALAYEDSMDMPLDAGVDRCVDAGAATRDVAVRIEITHGGSALTVAIPQTAFKKEMWGPNHNGPVSCRAGRTKSGDALEFECGEDLTSIAG